MAKEFDPIEPSGHIVLDIETIKLADDVGGWDFTGEMGVACAVVYEVARDRHRLYDASELEELRACLDRADRITTWNGWNFDLPVIYGINRPDWKDHPIKDRVGGASGKPLRDRSRDLLRDCYSVQGLDPDKPSAAHAGWKLQDVAEALFREKKCNDGANAPELYKQRRWGELLTYCLYDVVLTTKIERFARQYGFLMNMRGKIVRFARKEAA